MAYARAYYSSEFGFGFGFGFDNLRTSDKQKKSPSCFEEERFYELQATNTDYDSFVFLDTLSVNIYFWKLSNAGKVAAAHFYSLDVSS